jgi:hypothetical protein
MAGRSIKAASIESGMQQRKAWRCLCVVIEMANPRMSRRAEAPARQSNDRRAAEQDQTHPGGRREWDEDNRVERESAA